MLKLLILPVPVVLGPGCFEGPILPRCEGVVKVAKAIEYLEGEAQGKRGRSTAVNLFVGIADGWLSSIAILLALTNHSIDHYLGDTSRGAQPSVHSAVKGSSFKKTGDNQWTS